MDEDLQLTLDLLKRFEGFRDSVYLDGNGIPTIGYGFTDPELIKKGKISREQANRRLLSEVRKRDVDLQKKIKNWKNLSKESKAALRSYYYNFPKGFNPDTNFIKYWNRGDYDRAIAEVDAGINDKNNPGLRSRRLYEQDMLKSDPYLVSDKSKWDNYYNPARIPVQTLQKQINTQYPIDNNTPTSISSWSSQDSPAYKTRVPSVQEINAKNQKKMWDLFDEAAVAYGKKKSNILPPLDQLMSYGKEQYIKDITGTPSIYDNAQNNPTINKFLIPTVYANKGKDLPKYAPGKDDEQVERGGITYNVHPSALTEKEMLNVEVPNTNVRSTPGMLRAREIRNENARKMAEEFLAKHPFGPNTLPVEPGLELTFPEFEILTLVGGVAGLGTRTTNNLIKNNLTKEVPDAISAAVSPRQAAAARRALSKRFDPEELTGSSIADDIAEYYGKNYNQYPTQVKNSIENSVYPRMREMRPLLTDNQFKSAFNYAADGKYTAYPVKTFQAANGPESRITASYYPDADHIAVRAGRITDDLGHEIEHKLDDAIPMTKQEDNILSNAYKQIAKDERKTTNYEARKALLGPYADQNLSILEQNKIIDAASDEEIFEAVAKSNGYGYDFMEALRENDQLTIEIANAIRQAMKKVGAYSAPIVSGAALYNSMQGAGILAPQQVIVDGLNNYNKGKDIYIKPSKRGTFTAAAKKRGKSVQAFASQVLANPGNYSSAMRKKAQFARNAKKWKH